MTPIQHVPERIGTGRRQGMRLVRRVKSPSQVAGFGLLPRQPRQDPSVLPRRADLRRRLNSGLCHPVRVVETAQTDPGT